MFVESRCKKLQESDNDGDSDSSGDIINFCKNKFLFAGNFSFFM